MEKLQVGKRTIDRGTTSIRRYVVRKPVEESVTLHDETVSIERRRPVTAGEAGVPAGPHDAACFISASWTFQPGRAGRVNISRRGVLLRGNERRG